MAVLAQQVPVPDPVKRFEPLSRRLLPEYTPNGFRVGSFDIASSFETGITYDDNIYASNLNKQSDFIKTFTPRFSINSDFVRHALGASFSLERGLYNDFASENYTDFNLTLNGRLDIAGQTAIPLDLSYGQDHYDRNSEEERVGGEPTSFNFYIASTGLVHSGQRLAAKVITTFERYVFKDTSDSDEFAFSSSFDNSDRNRNDYSVYASVGAPEEAIISPFLYSRLKRSIPDSDLDNNGFDRRATEYEFGSGALLNLSDITRATFNVGYVTRDSDDDRFETFNDVAFDADIIWEPSTLASFTFSGTRYVDQTITTRASASTRTVLRLGMNYELAPNVIVTPFTGYRLREFEDIDREVTAYEAGIGAEYKMNQNIWLSTSYRYITQDDTRVSSVNDFDGNTVNLSLKLQF